MKTRLIVLSLLLTSLFSFAQEKYITHTAHIKFFSTTPVEDIEADSYQASSVINTQDGALVFQVPMRSFEFEKALMQEHFNENYVESDKYPKSLFKGKIKDFDSEMLKEGKREIEVTGTMTIHGVKREIAEKATLEVKGQKPTLHTKFMVAPADYEIKIPGIVKNKIAKELEVTVKAEYEALQ